MGRFVNPGNSAFAVALNSEIYIDKTDLLIYTNKVMNTLQGYICNSRPRRFGKSMTADMLTAYYSRGCNSEIMFSKLSISKHDDFKKHLNQYDVIHLDIQWCIGAAGSADQVLFYITEHILEELKQEYPNLLTDKITSIPDALSSINAITEKKFIIIIDEWDVLIRDEANNQKIQGDYIHFLQSMFKGTEPMKYIQLAYLTGILPIKKVRTQSALNNFEEFTMLNASVLAPFIGFTETEVQKLCIQYQQDFDKVKCWYDGYLIGSCHVYNPKAVVSLMLRNDFQSYWSETGSYEVIIPLINLNFDGLKSAVIEMLSGNSTKVNVKSFQNDPLNFTDKDDVLTYMIHLGYLAYDQKRETAYIPNEEIREELIRATRKKKWNELISFQESSSNLLDATLDMDPETVAEYIDKIHEEYTSVIQYNDENSLSSVLSIAYLSTLQYYFKPLRELPTGRGFADFVYIPKPEYQQEYPALVVELKWNKNVKTALQQIKEKHYPDSISQYTGQILLVGISYDKKTKNHQCAIERFSIH